MAKIAVLALAFFVLTPPLALAQQAPQRWGEDWDGDGKDDHFFRDADRDGNPEYMTVDMDEDGTPEEAWWDLDDDGDWDAKMENDGDNLTPAGLPDWDRYKSDSDKDHDFDKVTEDTDNDGSFSDETVMDLNPQEAIPPNRPQKTGAQRNQGCLGPGCPNSNLLGACVVTGGGCLNDTDSGMCSAFGVYSGNSTVCTTASELIPALSPLGAVIASLALGAAGWVVLMKRR